MSLCVEGRSDMQSERPAASYPSVELQMSRTTYLDIIQNYHTQNFRYPELPHNLGIKNTFLDFQNCHYGQLDCRIISYRSINSEQLFRTCKKTILQGSDLNSEFGRCISSELQFYSTIFEFQFLRIFSLAVHKYLRYWNLSELPFSYYEYSELKFGNPKTQCSSGCTNYCQSLIRYFEF